MFCKDMRKSCLMMVFVIFPWTLGYICLDDLKFIIENKERFLEKECKHVERWHRGNSINQHYIKKLKQTCSDEYVRKCVYIRLEVRLETKK